MDLQEIMQQRRVEMEGRLFAEQICAKIPKTISCNGIHKPNSRTTLRQITEKYQSKRPNIRIFKYLCGNKWFDLWMVTNIE